jgi:hypothetical protein
MDQTRDKNSMKLTKDMKNPEKMNKQFSRINSTDCCMKKDGLFIKDDAMKVNLGKTFQIKDQIKNLHVLSKTLISDHHNYFNLKKMGRSKKGEADPQKHHEYPVIKLISENSKIRTQNQFKLKRVRTSVKKSCNINREILNGQCNLEDIKISKSSHDKIRQENEEHKETVFNLLPNSDINSMDSQEERFLLMNMNHIKDKYIDSLKTPFDRKQIKKNFNSYMKSMKKVVEFIFPVNEQIPDFSSEKFETKNLVLRKRNSISHKSTKGSKKKLNSLAPSFNNFRKRKSFVFKRKKLHFKSQECDKNIKSDSSRQKKQS